MVPVFMGTVRAADDSVSTNYVEPGTVRFSHDLRLENLMHRTAKGWKERDSGIDKFYSNVGGTEGDTWKAGWGASLLTEVATRVTPDIFGRVLFELQGDYADRYWRPNNIGHYMDNNERIAFVREAQARVDRETWYLNTFAGVGHDSWEGKGDFFGLYPAAYPDDDYLRHSGYFGIYPENFKQNLFMNISHRRVPRGSEFGVMPGPFDADVAYGDEMTWGYGESGYARLGVPLRSAKLTFVYKDEDVPYTLEKIFAERDRAYALSLEVPSEEGHNLEMGVKYEPFRVGDRYLVDREVGSGEGLLGSSHAIDEKKVRKKDGLAGRLRLERHSEIKEHPFVWILDLTRAGVVAGNKEQVDFSLGTDIVPTFHGNVQYVYRRPVEGPIPFLYEGTPNNIGNIAASPRGPESPFFVNWDNREAVFLITTLVFDPTPGSQMFLHKPDVLQMWNVNPQEASSFDIAFQHRMSDYRTTTDRQYYRNSAGDIVFEPPAHSGAWATQRPLHEYRLLFYGKQPEWNWTLGLAAGESPAMSGLAYSLDTVKIKPITEYYSFEGKIERWPFAVWAHYGSGVWGPEPYQHFLGETYDRLWGLGASYKITVNTTVDVSYIGARQDDNLFVAPDLGSFDEIRTVFSHRFGFLFQVTDPVSSGYKAR